MRTSISDTVKVVNVISKKYRQITAAVAYRTIAAMAVTKELN